MENIPFSRYRSKRSRKRLVKEDLIKQIRQKFKRLKEVEREIRNIPLLPLPEPFQKGFKRFFVLRQDVKESSLADFYQSFLPVINTFQYSENTKFLKKIRRKRKKIYIPREQHLKTFSFYEFHSPKCKLDERQKAHFILTEYYDSQCQVWRKEYEFVDKWRYVLKIAPHMITHYRPINEDLERERNQLYRDIFENYKNYAIFKRKVIYSRHYQRWSNKHHESLQGFNPLKGLSKAQKQLNYLMDLE